MSEQNLEQLYYKLSDAIAKLDLDFGCRAVLTPLYQCDSVINSLNMRG